MKKYMGNKTAVIEIMIPLAYFNEKYRYQEVPLRALDDRLVYVKKGSSGYKSISIKNIKLLDVFDSDDKQGIKKYLDELRGDNMSENIKIKKVIKGYLNEFRGNNITENIGNNPIQEVFNNNPELSKIGSMEEYSKYINTIFPKSQEKNIVYHDTRSDEIEGGKLRPSTDGTYGEGIYVQMKREFGGTYGGKTLSVIINTRKAYPFNTGMNGGPSTLFNKFLDKHRNSKKSYWVDLAKQEFREYIIKDGYDAIRTREEGGNSFYILFEPEQTHILGTQEDIEGFKKYLDELRSENINENIVMKKLISEGLKYHLINDISVNESIYRPGSEAHIDLLSETRRLYDNGSIELNDYDEELFETTDIGRFGKFRGEVVPLDILLIEYGSGEDDYDISGEVDIDEVEKYLKEKGWGDLAYENFIDFEKSDYYTGTLKSRTYANEMDEYMTDLSQGLIESIIEEKEKKHPPLGKIKRNSGSGKKYVVYVKNPSTGNIKKITFGDKKGGLKAKTGNSKARKSFSARHNCPKKKDRMTAGYWACRLNRSGLVGKTTSGYW